MKKMLALITARNKEFYRDRTAMIWTLLFPFIVLAGFRYGYSGRQDPLLRLVAVSAVPIAEGVISELKEFPGVALTFVADESAALKQLEHYDTDMLLSPQADGRLFYSVNADSDKGKLAERLLQLTTAQKSLHNAKDLAKQRHFSDLKTHLEKREVKGERLRYSDWLLPGLLAMNIMFGSMFGVGYVIVRYRKNGVLKRLRATPLSAFQFLSAQVVSRVLLMLVTSFMVIGGSMVLVGFKPQGSVLALSVFLCVSSAAMISLGLVVAARIANEEVADGVLNLMTWPMIFLSGIWFSIEGATSWVRLGAKAMPLTHVVDGLRAILIEGVGLTQVLPQITVLLCLSAVFLLIGSLIFKWR